MRELQIANIIFLLCQPRYIQKLFIFPPLSYRPRWYYDMPGVCGAGPTCPHWHWLSPHQQLWRSLSRLISLTNKTQSFYTIKAELGSTYRSPLILALGAGLKIFSSVLGSGAVIKVLCCLQVILTQMLIIYNKARTSRKNRSSIILIAVILVLWNNDNWPFCFVVTQI